MTGKEEGEELNYGSEERERRKEGLNYVGEEGKGREGKRIKMKWNNGKEWKGREEQFGREGYRMEGKGIKIRGKEGK